MEAKWSGGDHDVFEGAYTSEITNLQNNDNVHMY